MIFIISMTILYGTVWKLQSNGIKGAIHQQGISFLGHRSKGSFSYYFGVAMSSG